MITKECYLRKLEITRGFNAPCIVLIIGKVLLNDKGIETVVCEKGYRNHPLTEEQKKNNRTKSKIRCRVEHVFGFIEQSMKGFILRSVGMIRAKSNIFLTCLVYNIDRARKLNFI